MFFLHLYIQSILFFVGKNSNTLKIRCLCISGLEKRPLFQCLNLFRLLFFFNFAAENFKTQIF